MLVTRLKPTSPGRRNATILKKTKPTQGKKPLKNMLVKLKESAGRNNAGLITVRARGGGHKRRYRKVNLGPAFVSGIVESVEHSPFHSSGLLRVFNPETETRFYTRAVEGVYAGDLLKSGAASRKGSLLSLKVAPIGSTLFSLCLRKNYWLASSAGSFIRVLQKKEQEVKIQLPSGRLVWADSSTLGMAGIGACGKKRFIKKGKAGKNRWIGKRPCVRGVAMNPVDHPHGGGEGKTSGGRPSVTPWGKPAHGVPTSASRRKT